MVKIQPFGDRVVVEVFKPEEVMEGGLIISAPPIEKSNKGVIVAVGDSEDALKLSVNDIVLFTVGAGTFYNNEDKVFRVLNTRDIIGKIVIEEDK